MTKRISLGIIGLVIGFGLIILLPIRQAEAQVEASVDATETAVLKQTLDALGATLNIMTQQIQSQNLTSAERDQMIATLQIIQTSLVSINSTINNSAIAGSVPQSVPVASSPTVMVSKPVPVTEPIVTITEKTASALPRVVAEVKPVTAEASVVRIGGDWRNTARVIWYMAVAAFIGWTLYSQPWKKKLATPKTS